jgi:hypothetical protein
MSVVNPLTVEQAPPQVREAFDKLTARAGKPLRESAQITPG